MQVLICDPFGRLRQFFKDPPNSLEQNPDLAKCLAAIMDHVKKFEYLAPHFLHPSSGVRRTAAELSTGIDCGGIAYFLSIALADSDSKVAHAAAASLWQIKSEKYGANFMANEIVGPAAGLGVQAARSAIQLLLDRSPNIDARQALILHIREEFGDVLSESDQRLTLDKEQRGEETMKAVSVNVLERDVKSSDYTSESMVGGEEAAWQIRFESLQKQALWDELWQFIQESPVYWAGKALTLLHSKNYRPHGNEHGKLFDRLVELLPNGNNGIVLKPLVRLLANVKAHDSSVLGVACSPNGRILASAGQDKTIRLWQEKDGTIINRGIMKHDDKVSACAFSPDGQILASASWDGSIGFWNPTTGASIARWKAHNSHINTLSFSSDGKVLASGGLNDEIRIWDVETQACKALLYCKYSVRAVSFFAAKALLASADERGVHVWDLDNGVCKSSLPGHIDGPDPYPDYIGEIKALTVSQDGCVLAVGGRNKKVFVWDVISGHWRPGLQGHESTITDITFLSGGPAVATASEDKTVRIWDIEKACCAAILPDPDRDWILSVAYSPGNHLLVAGTGTFNGRVLIWEVFTASSLKQLSPNDVGRVESCIEVLKNDIESLSWAFALELTRSRWSQRKSKWWKFGLK